MDFEAVQAALNDLPLTFKKLTTPYTQIIDVQTASLSIFTEGVDGTMTQPVFANAYGGWLDVWGLVFGVQRLTDEGDAAYAARIQWLLLAWVGTVPGLQALLDLLAPGGSVTENLPTVGYSIELPSAMTLQQIGAFFLLIQYIRPAGVPFTVSQVRGGLFLGTIVFMGRGQVMGSYLTDATKGFPLTIPALVNSAQPLLPDLYLVDPSLNPSL